MERLILGSRGSALALAQVELVRAALQAAHPSLRVELQVITTSGDGRPEARSGEVPEAAGLKGLFTREIQDALLAGEIHAAIHSLKDLPGQTPAELGLAAVLPRAHTADILIAKTPAGLFPGARIGTGSVRRSHQLRWKAPEVQVIPLRGNVPTRLRKLSESGELDAIILARAGLERLGYVISGGEMRGAQGHFHVAEIDMLPAIGQGAIGIETRRSAASLLRILAAIDHPPTHLCIRAERELLRLLDGDCRLPVGMRTALLGDEIAATALVFQSGGRPPLQAQARGPAGAPEEIGFRLFEQLSA